MSERPAVALSASQQQEHIVAWAEQQTAEGSPLVRNSLFDSVAAHIGEALERHRLPSVAVAVAHRGEIIWEEGFGWADREARRPATAHTTYSLASVTKPITATALMLLVQRGLIDLDRPINDYLDDAQVRARGFAPGEATVRRVASHTAGLPYHYHFFYADEPHARPPVEETIRRYGYLMSPPGETFRYSNLGYGLLDHLITQVSGTPYAEFVRQEILLPLGMTRSAVELPPYLAPYAASCYGADDIPYPSYTTDHLGASAVWSSAHDLVRFGMFHVEGAAIGEPILSAESRAAMVADPVRIDASRAYGIGWGVTENELGYRTIAHDGGMGGVRTALWLAPSERLVIAVLMNSSKDAPLTPWTVRDEVAAVLLPSFTEALAKRDGERERAEKPATAPVEVPPALLGEWAGQVYTYQGETRLRLWIRSSDDIRAQLGDDLVSLVNEVSGEDGYLSGRMLGTMPTRDARKRPHRILLHLLRLRGEELTGAVSAVPADAADGGAPERRMGNAFTHPTILRRAL